MAEMNSPSHVHETSQKAREDAIVTHEGPVNWSEISINNESREAITNAPISQQRNDASPSFKRKARGGWKWAMLLLELKIYRLKDIIGKDLSSFFHNDRLVIDHVIDNKIWRFIVLDNGDETKVDGVSLLVFRQATSCEERFFELTYVQRTLMTLSDQKRVILAFIPFGDVPTEKMKKKFLVNCKDIFNVLAPNHPKIDRWMGYKEFRVEIRNHVGDKQYQKLMAQSELAFFEKHDEKYKKRNCALRDKCLMHNGSSYKFSHIRSKSAHKSIYDLYVVITLSNDKCLDAEEIKSKILMRCKLFAVVYLPGSESDGSIWKCHLNAALEIVEVLECRARGNTCFTRVVSICDLADKKKFFEDLGFKDIPSFEKQDDAQDDTQDDHQIVWHRSFTEVVSSHLPLRNPGPSIPSPSPLRAIPMSVLLNNVVDPHQFASINWEQSLSKLPDLRNMLARQAFRKKFEEWNATKTNAPPYSKLAVHGMKKVADTSPALFIKSTNYKGHTLRFLTREGKKLIKHLLRWMNSNIHRFTFAPNLMIKTARSSVYFDDVGIVVNLPPVGHQTPTDIMEFEKRFEHDIRNLIYFITNFCGGMANVPVMLDHLFGVMKEFWSWIDNFEFMLNHPVFWSSSRLDSFCQHMKNAILEMKGEVYSRLSRNLDSSMYRQSDWLLYVSNNIDKLKEAKSFQRVLEYSLSQRLRKQIKLPLPEDLTDLDLSYFEDTLGVVLWVRELYSHLSATSTDPLILELFKEKRSQLVFESVLLLFPIYFCQISWFLHKHGHRTWFN